MVDHEEALRQLNYKGKAHFGKEWTHGRVMTSVDISKQLAFRFAPASYNCPICQRLYHAARKVCTESEMEQLMFSLRHPESGFANIEP